MAPEDSQPDMEAERERFESEFGVSPTAENLREAIDSAFAEADWVEFPLTEEFHWPQAMPEGSGPEDVEKILIWTFDNAERAGEYPFESRDELVEGLLASLEEDGFLA